MVPFSRCWNKKKSIYAHHLKINHSATTTKSTLFIRKNTHTYREVMLEAGFSTAVQHSRWHCTVASGVTMKLTVTLFITVYLTFSHLSDATRAPCLNCVTFRSVVSFWFFYLWKSVLHTSFIDINYILYENENCHWFCWSLKLNKHTLKKIHGWFQPKPSAPRSNFSFMPWTIVCCTIYNQNGIRSVNVTNLEGEYKNIHCCNIVYP